MKYFIVSLEIEIATENEKDIWDQVVQSSLHGNIFHTWKWLSALSKNLNFHFKPLIIYKNNSILAIYPFFIMKKGLQNIALSPPIWGIINYMGPVIKDYEKMKLDKKTSVFFEVQKNIDAYLLDSLKCSLVRVRSSPDLYDPRPLRWCGYHLEPFFTYRINLKDGQNALFNNFDKKVKYGINKTIKEGVTIEDGDINDIFDILKNVNRRFIEQGYSTHIHSQYMWDIYNNFYPDNLKIFIAKYHGERISGMICPYFKGIAYIWSGIPKISISGISPNDLLVWEAMRWADEKGLDYLENIDAGVDIRLNHFKVKFNPELTPWYSAVKYKTPFHRLGGYCMSIIRKKSIN